LLAQPLNSRTLSSDDHLFQLSLFSPKAPEDLSLYSTTPKLKLKIDCNLKDNLRGKFKLSPKTNSRPYLDHLLFSMKVQVRVKAHEHLQSIMKVSVPLEVPDLALPPSSMKVQVRLEAPNIDHLQSNTKVQDRLEVPDPDHLQSNTKAPVLSEAQQQQLEATQTAPPSTPALIPFRPQSSSPSKPKSQNVSMLLQEYWETSILVDLGFGLALVVHIRINARVNVQLPLLPQLLLLLLLLRLLPHVSQPRSTSRTWRGDLIFSRVSIRRYVSTMHHHHPLPNIIR
jgi:hypothetical protein